MLKRVKVRERSKKIWEQNIEKKVIAKKKLVEHLTTKKEITESIKEDMITFLSLLKLYN